MAGAVATAAGGTEPLTLLMLMYKEHMSNRCEHSIVIDTEHAMVAADKKLVQAIQKAKCKWIESSNTNTNNQGTSHGGGGQSNDPSSHDSGGHGCGRGHGSTSHDGSSGHGSGGHHSTYVHLCPSNKPSYIKLRMYQAIMRQITVTLTMLLQHHHCSCPDTKSPC